MNGSPEDVQGLINDLQSQTKIPLLVAATAILVVTVPLKVVLIFLQVLNLKQVVILGSLSCRTSICS